MRFKKNDTITFNDNAQIIIEDFLGDGGQGEQFPLGYVENVCGVARAFFIPKNKDNGVIPLPFYYAVLV